MIIGDSIDVQVATRDVCVFEQRTLGIIVAAKEAKVEVLLDLETKEAFPDYSWYDLGESDMWDMVRKTYSMGPSPTGFVLHHYKVSRLGSLSSILSSFGFNIHSIFLLTIYIYVYLFDVFTSIYYIRMESMREGINGRKWVFPAALRVLTTNVRYVMGKEPPAIGQLSISLPAEMEDAILLQEKIQLLV